MGDLAYSGFISKKEIEAGKVYLYKDGRLALFIGYGGYGEYVFYELGRALLVSEGSSSVCLAHGEVQAEHLSYMCKDIMSKGISLKSLFRYKTFPQLYGEFPYVSYGEVLGGWWSVNKKYLGSRIPTVPALEGSEVKNLFVGARELVPGEIYYTGDSHRATYLYLGRDSMGRFCWWFIGNASILLSEGIMAIRRYGGIERTKSNKKCKLFRNIGLDRGAFTYGDYSKLVGISYNVSGLNLG